ncbi:MAG: hypothetical protein ACPGRG_10275 [Marinomonas sp.]
MFLNSAVSRSGEQVKGTQMGDISRCSEQIINLSLNRFKVGLLGESSLVVYLNGLL